MESDPKIIVSKANPGFKLNPVLDQKERDTILSQGAEGRIYLSELWGVQCIVKERFKKEYRVPILDERLTKARILQVSTSFRLKNDKLTKIRIKTQFSNRLFILEDWLLICNFGIFRRSNP